MHEYEQRKQLLQATIHEDAAEVHRLLDMGVSLKYGAYSDGMNASPLCHAAAQGNLEIVAMLARHGANLEGRSEWDCTPLTYAATNSHMEPHCLEMIG